ncbi:hypothetical protein Sjap_020333 [Stephania japonica]|uniref:Uncharacterized protein n=1 Tax=Stephania japonica TaxID=461633 RepID=A0AAP0I0L1_9MAGN
MEGNGKEDDGDRRAGEEDDGERRAGGEVERRMMERWREESSWRGNGKDDDGDRRFGGKEDDGEGEVEGNWLHGKLIFANSIDAMGWISRGLSKHPKTSE